eukprot:CAMPEP_0176428158 /NCGR_PEP_ID=MMETSP0127-20121128/12993_1 /TAXON_ID=938130 /ORGANISM="Platyophrya macrostoma, Strain WH" /LENGTH=375 /DNA_ID=CAMNT_0017809807 /DNA_START=22 /DNA_END=1149 /DNA_ORIENTATION=-
MEIWHYFAIFHAVWGVLITLWLCRLFCGGLDHVLKEDEDVARKYAPYRRTDIPRWSKIEMWLGGVFLLPYRLVITIVTVVVCGTVCSILIIGVDVKKEIGCLRRFFIRCWSLIPSRIIFYIWGFYWMEKRYHNICDLDPTYPRNKPQKNIIAPIVTCNHVSFLDIFYFLKSRYVPGFLSKASVGNIPFVGTIARARQCLFVNRTDRNQKDAVLHNIKERVDYCMAGKAIPPVLIFPEGTTTNGKYIITFKKGAFCTFAPVRILCIEYPKSCFAPTYDILDLPTIFFVMNCQLFNRIRVHDCGIYDPSHLELREEEDWKRYAAKVRNIMCKCLNVEPYEIGYEERLVYEKYNEDLQRKHKRGKHVDDSKLVEQNSV